MVITRIDLYKNQYSYEELKENIYSLSLSDILKTQKLTADFCVKYILNDKFQFLTEDRSITLDTVKKYQTHLSNIEILDAIEKATERKKMGEKIDSVEDFETYMNKYT